VASMKALNCAGGMPYLQSKMQRDALLVTNYLKGI